jgi:hypothetical protein
MRHRHTLIDRIMQVMRSGVASNPRSAAEPASRSLHTLASLEARVDHLEKLVEGFQDSVHRESIRQNKQIADLESRIEPAALAVALSRDASERGL